MSTPSPALQALPSLPATTRVLVVDDDDDVRVTLTAVLQHQGYNVASAGTVATGRELLAGSPFDVIIADLRLDEGRSGVDMVTEALERDPDIVSIILTGYVSTAAAVEALRGGVTNFLPKPCNIDDLQNAIQRGLEKRALVQELRAVRVEAAARREAEQARAEADVLYNQLQAAHRASELLANVGKELASSLQLEELIDRLARVAVPSFADWCVVDVVDTGYAQHVAVAHANPAKEELARELQRRFQPISAEGSPIRRVLDSGEPMFVPEYTLDIAPGQGVQDSEMELLRVLQPRSTISVPLSGRRGAIGVMSFLLSDSGRQFTAEDLELAREVAARAALAIENAQLYRDSQRSAIERREGEQRQRFIADASKVLDSSLDYRLTLENLARLAVPRLADWCVVDVLQDGKLGESVAIAAANPSKEHLAREYQRRWPPTVEEASGVAQVIRTGQPSLVPRIAPEAIEASARDDEHRAVIRALGPWTSGMVVPISARGETLGAITLITAESGRVYTQDDLDLTLEIAARAGLAVDNARLYVAEQRARVEAERLQALAEQLGQSLAVEQVLQVV
ncbi:MAG TPA: GAF domain-containing protein, partial [Chloroflexota bacterium]|nr:GAF domain-containing protein [Chloroflexota bacterium]